MIGKTHEVARWFNLGKYSLTFRRRLRLAWRALFPGPARMHYGDDGTIHSTGHVDVEVHDGRVVALWFRCAALPFTVHSVPLQRASEMRTMYATADLPRIAALDLLRAER